MAKFVEMSGDISELPEEVKARLRAKLGPISEPKAMHPLAQMSELQSRWNAASDVSKLVPGDLCLEKEGFQSYVESIGAPLVYMVWCNFDPYSEMHRFQARDFIREHGNIPKMDLWVGYIHCETNLLAFRPHCSAWLRPLSAEEQAALERLNAPEHA